MPFNTLLLTGLTSRTSFKESGSSIKLEPQSGETVLFFAIDDRTDPACTLRQEFGLTGAVCDCLVFYAKEGIDRKIVCLLELKGKNLKHAVEQVTNTYQHLRNALKQAHLRHIDWKTFIRQHGSAPNHTDREWIKRKLEENFGKGNFLVTRDRDIGIFLRG